MKESDGICTCCSLETEDIIHLFVECLYFTNLWNRIKLLINKIIDSQLDPFNQLFGFLSNGYKIEVVNMILSIARWILWKKRCSIKYAADKPSNLKVEDEFVFFLNKHIRVILKYRQASDQILQTLLGESMNFLI